jgi:hypothetical protein
VTERDQPRPHSDAALDAALDAVLPTLTAVTDDATASSLRRTRIALAEAATERRGVGAWRWAVPVAAVVVAALAAAWWPSAPIETPRIVTRNLPPVVAPEPPPIAPVRRTPTSAPAAAPLEPRPLGRSRVVAASVPIGVAVAPKADPVIALADAIQEIPDEAWAAAQARAESPLGVADLSVAPIVVPPLVTPPIADAPPAPPVQGEP